MFEGWLLRPILLMVWQFVQRVCVSILLALIMESKLQ